jgi:hypothetical protein
MGAPYNCAAHTQWHHVNLKTTLVPTTRFVNTITLNSHHLQLFVDQFKQEVNKSVGITPTMDELGGMHSLHAQRCAKL